MIGDRYRLSRPLGSGGMGEVWEAVDTRLDRKVAVKLLRPASASDDVNVLITRFKREAQLTARMNHHGVPVVHDTGADGTDLYLVMQLVEGADLADFQAENEPVSAGWIAAVGTQIASVLAAAHAAGLIHRDLKPRNVMITDAGEVKVLDFGIAALRGGDGTSEITRLTRTSESVGTPAYMAPEQAMHGVASPGSDLYSLGCVLYELAAGNPVFEGGTPLALMHQHYSAEPVPLSQRRPDLPVDLTALVDQLLAKQPEHRPVSAIEVRERLVPFVDHSADPGAVVPMDPTRPLREAPRKPNYPRTAKLPVPDLPPPTTPVRESPPLMPAPIMPAPIMPPPRVVAQRAAKHPGLMESSLIVGGLAFPPFMLTDGSIRWADLVPSKLGLLLAVAFAIVYTGAAMRQRRLGLPQLWSIENGLRWTHPPRPGNRNLEVALLVATAFFLVGLFAREYTLRALVVALALGIPAAILRQRRLGKEYPWSR
nr:serine/threonine-protein kinase [Kibdelosporangium sp. MJ126-NF4]CEL18945.1 serine/threonine protein kinase [Kibdelosporangium sp. MJ126-NF4]CTQ95252.1 serine/threonine protein kinase [Kibdelosporangium sp. MJ126-NF4]